jgi:AcrR family transcriptional regulator
MTRRASAAAQTRRRIIDATRALHTEDGIRATSYDAIAARAGVGVGTVYRHFPSLDELVPACGEVSMELAALPDADDIAALFDGAGTRAERLARLVAAAFVIYERSAPELHVMRREPYAHPSVAEAGAAVEASLSTLVDAAVGHADPHTRAVTRAMIDLDTWEAFRRAGLDTPAAIQAVSEILSKGS